MPGLPPDSWPKSIYFYDVSQDKRVKVHAQDIKFKSGSTKGHGPGTYYQIIAVKPNGLKYNLFRFVSEENFEKMKKKSKMLGKTSSPKKSPCNRLPSGKRKKKSQCKGKKCSWVKGVRGSRKGYCRRSR